MNIMMNIVQCRMARAALKWGIRELAKKAKVATGTISRFEAGEALQPRTVEAIQRAFEAAGIEFTNGDKPGVRVKKR
jgi:transcriptional regulator with XRE-family HTH domain